MALTVLALINAQRAMKRGDKMQTQRMFRARVFAQGFTIAAMCGGGIYYSEDRRKRQELENIRAQKRAEESRQQWIRELEIRDEEDKALRERMARRAARKEASRMTAGSSSCEVKEQKTGENKKDGGSGWLGRWMGSDAKDKPVDEASKPKEPKK